MDEIPESLINEESASNYGYSPKSSFSTTVSKIKEKKSISSYSGETTKATNPSNNLLSSINRIKESAKKAQNSGNLASSLANIKKITTTTTPKINYKTVNAKVVKKEKPREEKKKIDVKDLISKAKQNAAPQELKNRIEGLFPVGTRVFHSYFGVGKIKEIIKDSNTSSYVVEFSKAGEKTLDTATSGLKTF